jgi:hypothetical protein
MTGSKKTFFTLAKTLTVFHSRSRGPSPVNPLSSRALHEQLDAARPAERIWTDEDYEFAGTEGPTLRVLEGIRDGLWLCCGGHENHLTHYQGDHPFKHLTCYHCSHVLCPACQTTEILTPISSVTMEVFEPRFHEHHDEARYSWLCRACGLTHRAALDAGHLRIPTRPCPCGKPAVEEDSYFYIGQVDQYRRDPQGRAVEMRLKLAFAGRERWAEKNGMRRKDPESPARSVSATRPVPPRSASRVAPPAVRRLGTHPPITVPKGQRGELPRTATDLSRNNAFREGQHRKPACRGGARIENGFWIPG